VRLLLENGAAVDNARSGFVTPLWVATYYKHPEIVRILLEKGANPDTKNLGRAPIHFGTDDIVRLLIEHGANIFIKNNINKTRLQMNCHHKILRCAHNELQVIREQNKRATVLMRRGQYKRARNLYSQIVNKAKSDIYRQAAVKALGNERIKAAANASKRWALKVLCHVW